MAESLVLNLYLPKMFLLRFICRIAEFSQNIVLYKTIEDKILIAYLCNSKYLGKDGIV